MPVDAGSCPLDPGGTPCSQCIVDDCCNETETCLADAQCTMSMANYQSCTLAAKPPAQCAQMYCMGSDCLAWTACVAAGCATLCF
jgi:hypothetical protein